MSLCLVEKRVFPCSLNDTRSQFTKFIGAKKWAAWKLPLCLLAFSFERGSGGWGHGPAKGALEIQSFPLSNRPIQTIRRRNSKDSRNVRETYTKVIAACKITSSNVYLKEKLAEGEASRDETT